MFECTYCVLPVGWKFLTVVGVLKFSISSKYFNTYASVDLLRIRSFVNVCIHNENKLIYRYGKGEKLDFKL